MLGEILLVLAGYPSQVLSLDSDEFDVSLLTQTDRDLLLDFARFGQLHGQVKRRVGIINGTLSQAIEATAAAQTISNSAPVSGQGAASGAGPAGSGLGAPSSSPTPDSAPTGVIASTANTGSTLGSAISPAALPLGPGSFSSTPPFPASTHSNTAPSNTPEVEDLEYIRYERSPSAQVVAAVVEKTVLRPYGTVLIDLEKQLLSRDSAYVGGRDVVSMSFVASETVSKWHILFEYANELLKFVAAVPSPDCATILKRLDDDSYTGFSAIRTLSFACSREVQRGWLSQLSTWLIYGRLAPSSASDFMIQLGDGSNGKHEMVVDNIPTTVVSLSTAQDIFETGSSLAHLLAELSLVVLPSEMLTEHRMLLASLELPIVASQLQRAVARIRDSIFTNIVQTILPLENVSSIFAFFRNILLLGSATFGEALAANVVESQSQNVSFQAIDPNTSLQSALSAYVEDSAIVADNEVYQIASKSLKFIATDIQPSLTNASKRQIHDLFNDLPFYARYKLTIAPKWPHSLFLRGDEKNVYALAFSYLSALFTSRQGIVALWRLPRDGDVDAELWSCASATKQLLDTLWEFYQFSVIKVSFQNHIQHQLDHQRQQSIVDPQAIMRGHAKFLTELRQLLFIENVEIAQCLRKILINSRLMVQCLQDMRQPNGTELKPAQISADMRVLFQDFVSLLSQTEDDFSLRKHNLLLRLEPYLRTAR